MRKFEIGEVFVSSDGELAEIIGFTKGTKTSSRRATLRFTDGTIDNFPTPKLKSSTFVNKNFPRVCGVGYLGYGEYKSSIKGKESRGYSRWNAMMRRCYVSGVPAYNSTSVCREWHSYQNFAKWYYEHEPCVNSKFQLDKDLLGGGTLYSPDTCCLLPDNINVILVNINKVSINKTINGIYNVLTPEGHVVLSTSQLEIAEDCAEDLKIVSVAKILRSLERKTTDLRIIARFEEILTQKYKESTERRLNLIKQYEGD